MVERVARALAIEDGCNPDDPAYVRYPGGHAFGLCWRDKYAGRARAAIKAMARPTEAMIEAYCQAHHDLGFHAWANASYVLPRMIAAALGAEGAAPHLREGSEASERAAGLPGITSPLPVPLERKT